MPSKKWGICERCGKEGRLKAKNMHGHCYDLWREERKTKPAPPVQPVDMPPVQPAALPPIEPPTVMVGTTTTWPPAQPKPAKPAAAKPKPKARKAVGDCRVMVDFTPAPYLLEEMRRRGDSELRPLGSQVLWELKKAVEAGGAA
jgi:hypothetical protein